MSTDATPPPGSSADERERGEHAARELIEAGRVGRAHGLDGSFHVTRPVSRLVSSAASVTLAGRSYEVRAHGGTEQRPVLRLEGVNRREDAQALRGQTLLVEADRLPALGDDEFWSHELEGCAVYGQGKELGSVSHLIALPSCEALEVKLNDGGELLVPMVREAIVNVDVPARRIDVELGFLGVS